METLQATLTENRRRQTLQGREHVVAPLVLIVPGVLDGSQGPLLYPPEEIRKSLPLWNDMIQVVRHPSNGNSPSSARTAENLNKFGVGRVLNAQVDDQGRLTGEGWFDVEALRRIDAGLLSAIENGQKVELSTGLMTTNDPAPGTTTDGIDYAAIARNLIPDHLAILPDSVGACSVADGCGVNVNETSKGGDEMPLTDNEKKQIMDSLVGGCCWEEGDRPLLNELADDVLQRFVTNAETHADQGALAAQAVKEFTDDAGSVHTWNADDKLWKSNVKPAEPVANQAVLTPEDKTYIAFAKTVMQERRDAAIKTITANEANKLTAKDLDGMSLATLQNMAASIPQKPDNSYQGAAGAPPHQTFNEQDFAEFDLPHERQPEPAAA